ncbi:hypothetical protein SERLA73DRAFT_166046 [Serpula lacrymans var. lacrymans S7.3]|uniref:Ig-like domain-containing protein n=2 Tax=Serpula lacrymans var. lacrymans TaxID=341189 RepID=F8PQ25_SERL3|nr:uncharacterized protein SERLADRAFT_446375 [Serpula lacrymans var. lacrymans S7.9]EGO01490.1 hypothetical protein SERLA73DRAFT_166046 [Serpula lacrymans var. lacrymans S7.3]EGO27150.1 hypothetical protein SERLADRAFT_446375 [Serpula lacrymans var. lacrymans S7.9]
MSQLLKTYTNLTPNSPRSSVSDALRAIADDAAPALLAVKMMGRTPAGSRVISLPQNLSALLAIATTLRSNPNSSNEALKCIANTLLLSESSRVTWISKDIGGGEASVEMLERSSGAEELFLASRILFLCTASASSSAKFIQDLVETKRPGNGTIIDIIGTKIDVLLNSILFGAKMSREAMTDLLKFTFNLLVHYPKTVECESQNPTSDTDSQKVMGDFWSQKLDGVLPPLLRVFNSLPLTSPNPLTSPLTHAIHSLITIPLSPSLRNVWFGKYSSNSQSSTNSKSSPSTSSNSSPVGSNKFQLPGTSNRCESPTKETKVGALDRALSSVLAAGRRSLSRSSSPMPSSPAMDTVLHAYDLLDVSLNYFLPGNVDTDHASVRELCKKEGENSLDDLMSPLVLLLTRFCLADEGVRTRLREWLVPSDLDRTRPLEGRSDMLGRCLRLLGSVYHARLKDAVGEMLFAMCDSDATTLSSHFGYGNVAGFLFHKGIVNAPQGSSSSTTNMASGGAAINPITGTVERQSTPIQMTEEEKEREVEKLFTLFDRLEKTGAMPASQNPIRKAIHEGKLG